MHTLLYLLCVSYYLILTFISNGFKWTMMRRLPIIQAYFSRDPWLILFATKTTYMIKFKSYMVSDQHHATQICLIIGAGT